MKTSKELIFTGKLQVKKLQNLNPEKNYYEKWKVMVVLIHQTIGAKKIGNGLNLLNDTIINKVQGSVPLVYCTNGYCTFNVSPNRHHNSAVSFIFSWSLRRVSAYQDMQYKEVN